MTNTSMARRTYLDYNATSPVDSRVVERMRQVLAVLGNPSSIHEDGRAAREIIETSRRDVAAALAADPAELVFTSSGTEADALAIAGLARVAQGAARGRIRVYTTAIEHPACLGPIADLRAGLLAAEPVEVVHLPIDGDGRIDIDAAAAILKGPGVVVTHLANHELGTVQDISRLAALAADAGLWMHCDAVQAAGKIALDVAELGVDSAAISAHKIGGPKGVGALWVKRSVDLPPLFSGGHQERERRAGTENLAGIAGFGAAAALIDERLAAAETIAGLAQQLRELVLEIDGGRLHGPRPGIGNTVNAGFEGAPGEVVVQALDLEGVSTSTGAACSSGSVEPSAVLVALGLDRRAAAEAVRFSLGPQTGAGDIERVRSCLPSIVARAREFS